MRLITLNLVMESGPKSEIEACISRLSQGDSAAMGYLYMMYVARIRRFAMRLLGNEDDAFDMVHDVLLRLWNEREHLPQVGALDAYIFRTTRNIVLNHLKHAEVCRRYAASVDKSQQEEIPERVSTDDLYNQVIELIDGMPEQRRKVFSMSRFEHLKYDEIAVRLGISPRTVQYHITMAMSYLRSHISDTALPIIVLVSVLGS